MAPFSIDLPGGGGAESYAAVDNSPQPTMAGLLAAALARVSEADDASRVGRDRDRRAALDLAMGILDRLISRGEPRAADARWQRTPGELLRIMQFLLQANLTGGDAPLRLAADALCAVHQTWKLADAVVVDIR